MTKLADTAPSLDRRWRPTPGLLLAPFVLLLAWAVAEAVSPHAGAHPAAARIAGQP